MTDIRDLRPPSPEERVLIAKKNEEEMARLSSLYHRVFFQSEDGKKLYEHLVQSYVFGGFTPNDASVTALAKAEARREMVCGFSQIANRANQ